MRNHCNVLPVALAVALSSCAATDTGAPVLPGYVNAPPPPMAAPGDALLTNTSVGVAGHADEGRQPDHPRRRPTAMRSPSSRAAR